MKKRLLYLIFPIITMILEIIPYGAVCNFANPEGKAWRKTFSYFDLVPFGYANFAPLLTAIITTAIIVLLSVYLFTAKYRVITMVKGLLCVGVVLSLCPLFYGMDCFSVVGLLITISLVGELVWIFISVRLSDNGGQKKE